MQMVLRLALAACLLALAAGAGRAQVCGPCAQLRAQGAPGVTDSFSAGGYLDEREPLAAGYGLPPSGGGYAGPPGPQAYNDGPGWISRPLYPVPGMTCRLICYPSTAYAPQTFAAPGYAPQAFAAPAYQMPAYPVLRGAPAVYSYGGYGGPDFRQRRRLSINISRERSQGFGFGGGG